MFRVVAAQLQLQSSDKVYSTKGSRIETAFSGKRSAGPALPVGDFESSVEGENSTSHQNNHKETLYLDVQGFGFDWRFLCLFETVSGTQ
jgi:hypothetical protein